MDSIRETTTIQSDIKTKVNKTDKLAKDTNKIITSQKAKISEIEKLVTTSSESLMATSDNMADFKDEINQKLTVIMNALSKTTSGPPLSELISPRTDYTDHARHSEASHHSHQSHHSQSSHTTTVQPPNPFAGQESDSDDIEDNASVVSGVGDL